MLELFQAFFAKMKNRFSRLAKSTRNEKEVGDLHNDAFVIALDIGDKRGYPVDLSDPADQDLVMRELYLENVKRGDWKMRYAARIDQESEGEEEGTTLAERLPAPASSDPLISLLVRESEVDATTKLADSYSQATAYAITFSNFDNDRQRLCMHLVISDGALSRRVAVAAYTVTVQPSMYDCIERIPADFIPLKGRAYVATLEDEREAKQWTWSL